MHIAVPTYKKRKGYKIAKRFIFKELLLFSVLCFTTKSCKVEAAFPLHGLPLSIQATPMWRGKNSLQPGCNHVESLSLGSFFFFLFYYQAKTISVFYG